MVSEDVEHSPLPWRASTFAVYDANGVPAAHTGACGRSNKQRIANAELIVRAVNSFSGQYENVATARQIADTLANAIAQAAIKAGIYNGNVPLDGPQLVMLCDDLAIAALATARDSFSKEEAEDTWDEAINIAIGNSEDWSHHDVGAHALDNCPACASAAESSGIVEALRAAKALATARADKDQEVGEMRNNAPSHSSVVIPGDRLVSVDWDKYESNAETRFLRSFSVIKAEGRDALMVAAESAAHWNRMYCELLSDVSGNPPTQVGSGFPSQDVPDHSPASLPESKSSVSVESATAGADGVAAALAELREMFPDDAFEISIEFNDHCYITRVNDGYRRALGDGASFFEAIQKVRDWHAKSTSATASESEACSGCGHSVETWNAVTGRCEFDPAPLVDSVPYCDHLCTFEADHSEHEGEEAKKQE